MYVFELKKLKDGNNPKKIRYLNYYSIWACGSSFNLMQVVRPC